MRDMFFDAEETDEDFDNFKLFGKKVDSFADVFRSKAKIECIDDAKEKGSSSGDARKDCRKELGGNILVRGTKVMSLAVPRGAFLTLVRLNYRGLASRMERAKLSEPNIYKSAMQKFVKLGGSESKFKSAINFGKDKKPAICGAKCKAKVNFSGNVDLSNDELQFFEQEPDFAYHNVEPTVTTAIIASASAVLVPIVNIIGKARMTRLEAEADRQEADQFREQQDAEFKEDEKRRESSEKLVSTVLKGGAILVGVLVVGAITMKVIKRRRNKN
jgi:hypothetical protein